jgi:hypothetical protein
MEARIDTGLSLSLACGAESSRLGLTLCTMLGGARRREVGGPRPWMWRLAELRRCGSVAKKDALRPGSWDGVVRACAAEGVVEGRADEAAVEMAWVAGLSPGGGRMRGGGGGWPARGTLPSEPGQRTGYKLPERSGPARRSLIDDRLAGTTLPFVHTCRRVGLD